MSYTKFYVKFRVDPACITSGSKGNEVVTILNYAHTHQRKAPLRGARVRYRAPDALSALGGRDDQVDLGFGRYSEIIRSL